MLYAVHYRDMHTAIHHFALFTRRAAAELAAQVWEEEESLVHIGDGIESYLVDDIEIHWMSPPDRYQGEKVRVVNRKFDAY